MRNQKPRLVVEPDHRDVVLDRQVNQQAVGFTVFRYHRGRFPDRLAGTADQPRPAAELDLALVGPVRPEDGPDQLRPPGSDQPGDPDDLAASDGERAVAQPLTPAEARYGQDRLARLLSGADAEEIAEIPPDHRPDQLLLGRPAGHEVAGVDPVAVHGDPVAHGEDLLQPVGDEQEADAVLSEAADTSRNSTSTSRLLSVAVGSSRM